MTLAQAYEVALRIEDTPGWRVHRFQRAWAPGHAGRERGWMLTVSKPGRPTLYRVQSPDDWTRIEQERGALDWERGILGEVERLLRRSV